MLILFGFSFVGENQNYILPICVLNKIHASQYLFKICFNFKQNIFVNRLKDDYWSNVHLQSFKKKNTFNKNVEEVQKKRLWSLSLSLNIM